MIFFLDPFAHAAPYEVPHSNTCTFSALFPVNISLNGNDLPVGTYYHG